MATKISLDASQRQKLMEGLNELASMIATAYRRRITGETDVVFYSSKNSEENPGVEARTIQYTEPEDLRHEGEYTETVKVGTFLRRKTPSSREVKNS